jgi:hypothetical protein
MQEASLEPIVITDDIASTDNAQAATSKKEMKPLPVCCFTDATFANSVRIGDFVTFPINIDPVCIGVNTTIK